MGDKMHTPTPWVVDYEYGCVRNEKEQGPTGEIIFEQQDSREQDIPNWVANAERTVLCVNALEGVEDPHKFVNNATAILGDLIELVHVTEVLVAGIQMRGWTPWELAKVEKMLEQIKNPK